MGSIRSTSVLGGLLLCAAPAPAPADIVQTSKGSATAVLTIKSAYNSDGTQDLEIVSEQVLWVTSGDNAGAKYSGTCKGAGRFDKNHQYAARLVCSYFLKGSNSYTIEAQDGAYQGTFRVLKGTGRYASVSGAGTYKYVWANSSYDRYYFDWEMSLTFPP